MTQRRRVPVSGRGPKFTREDFAPGSPREAAPEEHQDEPEALDASDAPAEIDCDCPRLDPEDWHDVESDWSDITFASGGCACILGVPVHYRAARDRLRARTVAKGATVADDAMTLLGKGQFRRRILVEAENVPAGARGFRRPGGIAYTRLVPAPPGRVKAAVKDTVKAAKERYGRGPDGTWLWFLTCARCSVPRDFETLIVAHYKRPPA